MYIFKEEPPVETDEYSEYHRAYSFIGEPEEITEFKRCAASILLGAVISREVSDEHAAGLFTQLATEDYVIERYAGALVTILDPNAALTFKRQRRWDIYAAAKAGSMSLDAAFSELQVLDNDTAHPDVARPMDHRGLLGSCADGTFSVNTYTVEPVREAGDEEEYASDLETWFGDDSLEMELVQNSDLPINAFAVQIPYVPVSNKWPVLGRVASKYEHTMLGHLDDNGNFEPLLAVLDSEHPVRNTGEADTAATEEQVS